jgi:hypothetical protein
MKTVLGGLLLCWAASSADAPSQFTKLDGHRVHYKVYGRGAPAVVLIHGWTCDLTF